MAARSACDRMVTETVLFRSAVRAATAMKDSLSNICRAIAVMQLTVKPKVFCPFLAKQAFGSTQSGLYPSAHRIESEQKISCWQQSAEAVPQTQAFARQSVLGTAKRNPRSKKRA